MPGENRLIPVGLSLNLYGNVVAHITGIYDLMLQRVSVLGSCTIDANYTGPVYVPLHNGGPEAFVINNTMKIAQIAFYKPSQVGFIGVLEEEEDGSAGLL